MALTDYKSSLESVVEKDPVTGKYTVNTSVYAFANKIKEESTEYDPESPTPTPDPEPDPFPEAGGTYQRLHPTTYRTDTSVQNAPMSLNNVGIACAFVNCVSLTSIDLTTDVSDVADITFTCHHAFAGCKELTTVNLGTYFETISTDTTLEHMFDGCIKLATITGTIDLSNISYTNMKDMFKNCTSLTAVSIKNGVGDNDITAENVEVDGVTYAYAYEILGLTAEQFASAVTLVTE